MNRPHLLLGVLLAALALTACDGVSTPDLADAPSEQDHARSSSTLTLVVGETILLGTGGSLTFEAVVSDNRCPADVNCLVAGEARTRFSLHNADGTTNPIELAITGGTPAAIPLREAQRAVANGYVLYLLRLQPYPGYEPDAGMPVTATLGLGSCRSGCSGGQPSSSD